MLKITFLGTRSGVEPIPNRHHSSFVLEINQKYYWFDAGENCSHKAYTSGIDVSRVRAVFISHMHIDHIGGLANLLFTIKKVSWFTKKPHINDNSYDVFVPDIKKFESVKHISNAYREPFSAESPSLEVNVVEHQICDGVIFEDENLRVSALHNRHLKENGENGWHSFSFLIEAKGKRIVFSGDLASPEELDAYMQDGCDALIMETGHHSPLSVCTYANKNNVKKLLFTHHGRAILRDFGVAEELVSSLHNDAKLCNDGDTVII